MFETMTREEAHEAAKRLGERLTNELTEAIDSEDMDNVYLVFVRFGVSFLNGVEESLKAMPQEATEDGFQA